jgi:cytoskeletal protein RodZ
MKTQVWVYIVVVVLSVGAGVAIAGLPNSVAQDPTIQLPATTEASEPEPVGTDPADTEPTATEPAATDPAVTDPVDTEPENSIESTTATSTTTTTTTTTAPTTTTTTSTSVPLPERSEVDVEVVNAANVGGAASRVSSALEDLGYVDVGSFDGREIVDVTIIYAEEGFQGPADRLAAEIGMEPGLVFPISAAPDIDGLVTAELIVLLGRDVTTLSIYG